MKKYGYMRVSTKEQNTDRQFDALMCHGIRKTEIYADYLSGSNFNRPEYKRLLNKLKKGDCLVIKSIDRLGRNYSEILEQWRYITKEKEADIEVLDIPLLNTACVPDGLTGVFISDLVLQILAYVAETEKSFIKQRQREGIESARKRGIHLGRPRVRVSESFVEICEQCICGFLTVRSGAKLLGMSQSTFYRRFVEYRTSKDGEKAKNHSKR